MAGLACAWSLSRRHEVTLFERYSRPGLSAHAVEIDGESVDVPLRVFFDGYYPALLRLYRELGIKTEVINYSGSFSSPEDGTYFSYHNRRIAGRSVPVPRGRASMGAAGARIARDSVRLAVSGALRDLSTRAEDQTIFDYLSSSGYSDVFIERFIIPTYAAICTCSYDAVREYPARVILEYLRSGLFLGSVRRIRHSAGAAVTALTGDIAHLRCNAAVARVEALEDGVRVTVDGNTEVFDHAVFATQANQATSMVAGVSDEEISVLNSFKYESSTVAVHRDASLMPSRQQMWSPVNFWIDLAAPRPSATIWMNAVQPGLAGAKPVFQTWNPVRPIDAASVIAQATFERPVVGLETEALIERLDAIQQRPGRRVWYCGSYAGKGIPLLEAAATSGLAIADRVDRI